jgi:HSP20 family protein
MHFLDRNDHLPLNQLRNEVNSVFQRFFEDPFMMESRTMLPPINLREETNRYIVEAELPGLSAKDIQIDVNDRVLTIYGEKKSTHHKEEHRTHLVESRYGSFQRSITLPKNANLDQITAEHKRGILFIFIPKDQADPPRQIEIKEYD